MNNQGLAIIFRHFIKTLEAMKSEIPTDFKLYR